MTIFKKESEIIAILFLLPVISIDKAFLLKFIKGYITGCVMVALIVWLGTFNLLPYTKWATHFLPYYIFLHIYATLFMAFGAYLAVILLKLNWQKSTRWVWIVIFILISYNVLWQSLSRTGYVIYMVMMLVFFLQNFNWKGKNYWYYCFNYYIITSTISF